MAGFYVLLAVCACVVVLVWSSSRRTKPRETAQGWIESLVVAFMDHVEDPAREAWKFKDADWQQEAEQWLAKNERKGLPEFRSAMARRLAALAKDHYSETMQLEFNEAVKDFQQDRAKPDSRRNSDRSIGVAGG